MSDFDDRLVQEPDDLRAALEVLAPIEVLAVDTEFHWERTYRPRLGLIQVAGRDAQGRVQPYAVDPLAVDPGPLFALLAEPTRLKVFHAGRIDLQILARAVGAPVAPVFDTQIAAALVGLGYQVSYAKLVGELAGESLGKAHQYSDWTRRPLSASQLEYALLDVIHLLAVHGALVSLLQQTGRAAWAEEEMAHLVEEETYVEPPDEEVYLKVKAHRSADPRTLAVLRRIAAWREREARDRDIRPGFILKDVALVDLARRAPTSLDGIRRTRGLHEKEFRRSGKGLLAAIRLGVEDEPPPRPTRGPRRKVDVAGAVDLLKACLTQHAIETGVASEVIATTSDLERLAKANARGELLEDHPVLQGWRGELVGRELLSLLKGEVSLGVDPETGALRTVDGSG